MTSLRNVAVVGFEHGPIVECDEHLTSTEMLYPQVRAALDSCRVDRASIDYQIGGSSDFVDGRSFGFTQALDVTGSWPPVQDSHLEMDAAFAVYYAWLRIQAGAADTAIVTGFGKPGEGELNRILNLQLDPFYQAAIGLDAVATAALQASAYMERSGVTDGTLAEIASRNRQAGAKNPAALLREPATAEQMLATPWAVQPLRKGYLPAIGEAAACLVLAAEGKAERMCDRPAWIHGVDHRSELHSLGARDLSRSAGTALATKRAFEMAGVRGPEEIELIEHSGTNPVEELVLLESMGIPRGATDVAINPSGGPMVGHPILTTGLIRVGEVFRQISGRAGAHATSTRRRALAHATQGHCLQQNVVFVLGAERRWT